MSFEALLFYFFASVMVAASLAVVTLRNPVHCALALVLTFFTCACLWLLLRAEFLAIALGAGLCRRGDGAVPVRGDDARHQDAARVARASPATCRSVCWSRRSCSRSWSA